MPEPNYFIHIPLRTHARSVNLLQSSILVYSSKLKKQKPIDAVSNDTR